MWKTQKVQKKSQKSRAKFEAKNGSKMANLNTKIWPKSAKNLHKNAGDSGGLEWPFGRNENGRILGRGRNDLAAKII